MAYSKVADSLSLHCSCTSYQNHSESLMALEVLTFSAGISRFNLKPLWCKMIAAEVVESPTI